LQENSMPLADSLKDALNQPPPIATFDEWTKENNGAILPSKIEGNSADNQVIHHQEAALRNYASSECGAKVLLSNKEVENKNAVLNEKARDDYMRNPCERAQSKWFIIELCETIQPTFIVLANFELFSSGPREIRLSASERYPTNDWIILADIIAENSREIQQFPISANGIYAKFIRVELLSHYGNEHYCTLSMIRLLGISMVDEYEAEAQAAISLESPMPSISQVNFLLILIYYFSVVRSSRQNSAVSQIWIFLEKEKKSIFEIKFRKRLSMVFECVSFFIYLADKFLFADIIISNYSVFGVVLIYYCLGQTLPGGSLSHKESIFLKLNKRIGNLELNLSLSNEYLSELSRRYVEQTNDSRKQVEKLKVNQLRREVRKLRKIVSILSLQCVIDKNSENERGVAKASKSVEKESIDDEMSYAQIETHHHLHSNDNLWTVSLNLNYKF
uniref:SUN domain-containing protein n=1 Tax=Dracunculus medinensis TaxID=318479 RepID=A0A0N4U6C7_DRAME